MLPLKDTVRASTRPIVMPILLVVNVLVFVLIELPLSEPDLNKLLIIFGVVPARLVAPPIGPDAYTLVTSQFLHGGWLHLASNMLALWIFADNVEDRMGHLRFLLFYLICGVLAGLTHVWADPTSTVPALGASGALAGVLAAYMLMFPKARVLTLVPVFILPWVVEIPAVLWLGGWFVSQLFQGFTALTDEAAGNAGGVGYWAHVGGFVAGALLNWVFRRSQPQPAPGTAA
ncbi:MAG TPA: rhomboid family intramembrane serine protease [Chloroflexota bacterium]|jgi:membrane associated rhomboid family serine protease